VTSRGRPTIEDVQAAATAIAGIVRRTPFVRSAWLSTVTGADVWLKLEGGQRTGSFKLRGAVNAIARLVAAQPSVQAVMAASAGNHAAGLATAASHWGLKARLHVPESAPLVKRQALVDLGAEVVLAKSYDEAEQAARVEAARGATFISAYSHPDVIAGAGTAALEMVEERADLDTFVVPVGGGGLLSGTAIVARARTPGALVIGAEANASPVWKSALTAGHPVTVEVRETLADGLAGNMEPDSITFEIIRDLVDRIVGVEEHAIASAMRQLMTKEHTVSEGAGATGVAALLQPFERVDLTGRRVGVIVSGGNVDPGVLKAVLSY
jgi:threonine dehydratase